MMKKVLKNCLSFLIFFCFFQGGFVCAESSHGFPYESTTVGECVREEACVWYAFKSFLPVNEEKNKILISRWDKAIDVANLSRNGNVSLELQKLSGYLSGIFPYAISEKETINYVILVSNDFKTDVYEKYALFFRKSFGNIVFEEARLAKYIGNLSFISIPLKNKNGSILAHVLILKDDEDIVVNLNEQFFLSMALTSDMWIMPHLKDFRPERYSKLHKLILKILYSPDFQNGEIIMDDAYRMFQERYSQILNDNNETDGIIQSEH